MKIKYFTFLILLITACKSDPNGDLANVVNVRLEGEPRQLNPIRSTVSYDKQVEWQIFMPLLQFDATTLELYPVLAKARPEIETIAAGTLEGGRKYTFELRGEAKWDDGQPVSPADFIFTLKAFFHPAISSPGLRAFLGFIEKVEVAPSNPNRFSVYTNKAFNLTEEVLGTMAIYPAHIYDEKGIFSKYPINAFIKQNKTPEIFESDSLFMAYGNQFNELGNPNNLDKIKGCGPYEIEDWIPGQRIILNRKENWWADKLPKEHQSFCNFPEKMVYHFIKDDATLSTMLKEQKIDIAAAIDPIIFDELKKRETASEAFNFYTPLSPSYYFISFNTKKPKLASAKLRRAVSHLVDVESVISLAMNDYAVRTTGPILPNKPYYNKSLKPIAFDLERARILLEEAGWKDNNQDGILEQTIDGEQTDCILTYKYSTSIPVAEKVGLLLKDNAIKAGIVIELDPMDNRKLIEDTRARDFDLYFSRWLQTPGPDDLRNIWHSSNDRPRGFNKAGFGDAQTDALIDSINVELDTSKRTALYLKIQEHIYKQQPYIFLFVPTERILVNKRFKTKASTMRPGYFENTLELRTQ